MANSNFAGSFAAGLVNGYVNGKKMQQAQELHDAQMKKFKDDEDMKAGIKAAVEPVKVQPQFTVTASDGSTMSADTEKAAAALAKGVDGASIAQTFNVGGQRFATQAQADRAAFTANDPVTQAQRVAAVYNQFGKPDMAMASMQQANALMDLRAQETFKNISQQIASNDYAGISKTYGDMSGDHSVRIQQGRDGSVIVTKAGDGGAPVLMRAFKSADDFRAGVAGILQNSPKDMLAQYWLQKNYDQRQQTADRQFGLDQQRVGLQAQGLGISAGNSAESSRHNREMEDIARTNAARVGNSVGTLQGLDPSGKSPNVFVTPVYKQFDPKTGSYGIAVGLPQDTGVKPMKTDLFGGSGGLGGLGVPGGAFNPQSAVAGSMGGGALAKAINTPAAPAQRFGLHMPSQSATSAPPAKPGPGLRRGGTPFGLPSLPAGSYHGFVSPGQGLPGSNGLGPTTVPFDPNHLPPGYPALGNRN